MSIEYEKARRGYPDKVYEYLKSLIKTDMPTTLDVGCGTGISTRELRRHLFEVIGSDKDDVMICTARKNSPEISYVIAPANKLPFDSKKFDIVTAFTAFHWFNNEESLDEIKRVLKTDGIFFAALKTNRKDENEDFRKGYISILKKYAGDNFDTTKNHFNKDFLIKSGFSEITERSFPVDEQYSVEEALTLIRSLSLWNLVDENKKPEMLKEMKEFYEGHLINGFVVRSREISTITAYNR